MYIEKTIKTSREEINNRNKSKAVKELEECYKDIELKFEYKTVYYSIWGDMPSFDEYKTYSKTYYEISRLNENKERIKICFYSKRGHQPLYVYLEKAFRTGGDEITLEDL